ncbi:hypothetical protein T4B_7662 [Trichinella pseudospiralis]|uniref:Uncharacterized protein n=1 Tax=Trichinella pseudospiralis TaxID=6337 RepID=A0A0V1HXJ3_TRIPS|nr:hypothetical protein T4B_7662 [Trichinella pseudospiralis]
MTINLCNFQLTNNTSLNEANVKIQILALFVLPWKLRKKMLNNYNTNGNGKIAEILIIAPPAPPPTWRQMGKETANLHKIDFINAHFASPNRRRRI